ncbi:B3 domain-containing protein Os03g0120900-like [Phragmites australis]|uniref:B3 domain-containing protein Os03g0120900-like n=1 Tax=Phragmites australis TaxID=29695 RepID=UPI002D79177B|nr:B3 domain-containing protein Os03g0120900-like [Phragmites australis]
MKSTFLASLTGRSQAPCMQPRCAAIQTRPKILTPSDIGKVNCFLIPLQDAERYFPMAASRPKSNRVSFISFEERHFRYCSWSSSSNYFLTRGWTTFVLLQRAGGAAGNRRFIQGRQRGGVSGLHPMPAAVPRSLTPPPGMLYSHQPLRQGLRFHRSIYGSGASR